MAWMSERGGIDAHRLGWRSRTSPSGSFDDSDDEVSMAAYELRRSRRGRVVASARADRSACAEAIGRRGDDGRFARAVAKGAPLLVVAVGIEPAQAIALFAVDRHTVWRPGATRACVGDSHTYGAGVRAEEAYPAQLQRFRRGAPEHLPVMNRGARYDDAGAAACRMDRRARPHDRHHDRRRERRLERGRDGRRRRGLALAPRRVDASPPHRPLHPVVAGATRARRRARQQQAPLRRSAEVRARPRRLRRLGRRKRTDPERAARQRRRRHDDAARRERLRGDRSHGQPPRAALHLSSAIRSRARSRRSPTPCVSSPCATASSSSTARRPCGACLRTR